MKGLGSVELALADLQVRIPAQGGVFECSAAALMLYEAQRQRLNLGNSSLRNL